MREQALLRLLAIALTAACHRWVPIYPYATFIYSIALTHYVLGLYYSKRQLAYIARNDRTWLPVLLLILAGAAMAWTKRPDFVLFFGLHIAFNDVYLARTSPGLNA